MFQEVGDCDAVSLGTEETSLVEDWDYTSEPVDAVMESTRNVSTRSCIIPQTGFFLLFILIKELMLKSA
jgi:hypothetical protein